MIRVTKLNGEKFILNCSHIITIEEIPESKITLADRSFFIVTEKTDVIVSMIVDYYARIEALHKHLVTIGNH
ncbi:MAG: flagellar FlbD family protein [Anaerotignaceae bacterium]